MSSKTFLSLGLPEQMAASLSELGYEGPTPIQAAAIPFLLSGRDMIGQAQTGTGKTAAFALPLLARLDPGPRGPQILVLTPTRELAIQVSESFRNYAASIRDIRVVTIYGGQSYQGQLAALRRGAQVVVGTPGRVCDHLRRGSLELDGLKSFVLDEADEMLRMGFIEDIDAVLKQAPEERQIALFSATMPPQIRRIAATYLHQPEEVTIASAQLTAESIRQRYIVAKRNDKIGILSRVIESEDMDAMLVFVRTKQATNTVAEDLAARGFDVEAMNGDLPQARREQIIQRLRTGKVDIIVATDVAARGLDVSRISHVVNFDAPTDSAAYTHRIGRTGRVGAKGEAILFVTPREKYLVRSLERSTRGEILPMSVAGDDAILANRVERFKERVNKVLLDGKLEPYEELVNGFLTEHSSAGVLQVAAALLVLAQRPGSSLLSVGSHPESTTSGRTNSTHPKGKRHTIPEATGEPALSRSAEAGMVRYRIELGRRDGVRPSAIVASISKTSGLAGKYIGRIEIHEKCSTVDLPAGMPAKTFDDLKRARIYKQPLRLSKV